MNASCQTHCRWNWVLQCSLLVAVSMHGTVRACNNPYYSICPQQLFPTKNALLPAGQTYSDTVPDTLDLATRAGWFIRGAIQTITPSLHDAPAGAVLRPETTLWDCTRNGQFHSPCLFDSSPNWGKVMRALTHAREMSPYDRNDTDFTLTTQHRMMTNMLDWDVTFDLLQRGYPGIVFPQSAITPQTVAMQAVMAEWQRRPSTALKGSINEFLRMHTDTRTTVTDSFGRTYRTVFYHEPNPNPETFIGYLGDYYTPFIHGKALRVMSEWYLATRDPRALSMANDLSDFTRNWENSKIWQNPDPARFTDFAGPGQFVGHTHSWLQAAIGLATHAEALRLTDPSHPLAQAELNLANDVYTFVKNRTRVGKIGNFGESGSTGDMAVLGIKLSEQNVGLYYDEVEAWARNALAETQIDPQVAQHIPNFNNNLYEHTNIGTKVTGMFFSDGTHIARVPFNFAGGTSDYAPNAFAGMHEVWKKTVEYKGNFAQINFGLNRASKFLDVKSDLPYRGQIEAEMKADIGPIDTIGVRVPRWADQQAVTVVERDAQGNERTLDPSEWSWLAGEYVIVDNVQSETAYLVKFPIEVYTETIYEMRTPNQNWYEGSYPTSSSVEHITPYTGTFRGNTLVDISPRPSGGFPRYQRQSLAGLPPVDVAPPNISLTRFVAGAACDFTGDGICHLSDVDALVAEILAGTNSGAFDLTGDGLVTLADINHPANGWLRVAGEENLGTGHAYLEGDANLDGVVDGSDFAIWNSRKFTATGLWSRADFNADGTTDGSDFGIWNRNKFTSSNTVVVPEPVTGLLLCCIIVAFTRRHIE